MKTKHITLIGTLACFFIGSITEALAQKIKVTESTENVGGSKKNALVVNIYNTDPSDIESKWKSLMKDYRGKTSTKDGVFADNAVITPINGNNTIDVYAKTVKGKDGEVKLMVAFDLGGAYLNSSEHKDKYNEAQKIVYEFAVKTTREAIAGQRKEAEKQLEKIEDQQKDLTRSNEKSSSNIDDYKKKIEDYKQRIKEAEDNIAKNKTELEKKKQEFDAQKKVVDEFTAKEKAVE